jgi:hypothetical protein
MRAGISWFVVVLICMAGAKLWLVANEVPAPSFTLAPHQSDTALATIYPVTIKQPSGPPRVATGALDYHGRAITVACSTCHTTRPANVNNRSGADLDLFHQGLTVQHGTNACVSCHNPTNYDQLHLADNSVVEFTNVVTLCAQCHGMQYRSYQHGAHGGMTGYWDLTRGPRQRNGCTSCHDPHVPKYQGAIPMPPPRDRFQVPHSHGVSHE